LSSIFENVKGISFEVIVVDNNSSDGSAEMVKNEFPLTNLVASDINTYYAKGNNIGYKISTGDYIGFLNPDTIVHPKTFEATVAYLRGCPKAGAVSCKFLNPDGSLQKYFRRFPNMATVFFCFTPVGALIDKTLLKKRYENLYLYKEKNLEKVETIDQPGTTFMVVPRTILEKIGIFDEEFPLFFNDVDLCKRIWKAGLEIHLLPDVTITHHGGKEVARLGLPVNNYLFMGCYRYFRKHHGICPALLVIIFLSTNLIPFFASSFFNFISGYISAIDRHISAYISAYIFNVKAYGVKEANRKAIKLVLKNIRPSREEK
jgi:GT2 family glycosyltransferase